MAFFSDLFTGASGKRASNDAAAAQSAYINSGYDKAETSSRGGYDQANAYINPYIKSGQQASQTYNSALNLNGQDGFNQAQAQYNQFAAPEQEATRNALSNQYRQYNRGSGGYSGGAALASARTFNDRYAQSRNNWLGMINGQQQQGWQASQAGAGLATDQGNRMGDYAIGRNTGLANTETQRIMGVEQARQQGQNNILKTVGGAAQLAMMGFTPGAGGTTPFENMATTFRGGSFGGGGGGSLPWNPTPASANNALARGWQ